MGGNLWAQKEGVGNPSPWTSSTGKEHHFFEGWVMPTIYFLRIMVVGVLGQGQYVYRKIVPMDLYI